MNKWLTSVTTTQSGHTYSVTYTYYPDGRRQTMTSPAGTTSYAYDAAGRPASLLSPFGDTTTWTYDFLGRVTSQFTSTNVNHTLGTEYLYGTSADGRHEPRARVPAHDPPHHGRRYHVD